MALQIIESYSPCGVNAGKIVRRMLRFMPSDVLDGLNAIKLLDVHSSRQGFGSYSRRHAEIETYVHEIIGWQPWLLKKSFIFPYLSIGLCLGHELDHHVHRNNEAMDR